MEVSGQLYVLATLSPGKAPQVPIEQQLSEYQNPTGEEKHFSSSGI
jgi:hypothetical protein